jgi:hypothetical protein
VASNPVANSQQKVFDADVFVKFIPVQPAAADFIVLASKLTALEKNLCPVPTQHRYNSIAYLLKNGGVQGRNLRDKQAIVSSKEFAGTGIADALQAALAEGALAQLYRKRIGKWIAGNLAQYPIPASGISQY